MHDTQITGSLSGTTLQWRHNERDSVSNYLSLDCLLNRLVRRRSKKTSNSASLAFVRGIHQWPVNSPHKGPVTRNIFPFHGVILKIGNRGWVLLHEMWSECSPVEMCFNEKDKLSSERICERTFTPDPPLILGECPHRGDSSSLLPPKNSKVFISIMPCKF